MKKALWITHALVLAAALPGLVLLRLPAGRTNAAGGGPRLWYCEGDCPRPVMEALLADYTAETGKRLDAVSFADEAALAEAFENSRPAFLLCSHVRAAGIDERLGLARLSELPPLPASTEEALSGIEGAFYPIGGRVPLLIADAERVGTGFESYEELLRSAAEAGTPFLAAESWSELLFQVMLSRGRQMSGSLLEDSRDAVYCELWNALAEAAYAGGLALVADPAEYVRQGLVPCAVVSSTALAGSGAAGLRVSPLPAPAGGRAGFSGELMGFAAVDVGKHAAAVCGFLQWLATGERGPETALAMGLVPLTRDAGEGERSALDTLLMGLAERELLRWPPASLPYFAERESCEAELRERLDLLG